MGKVLIRSLFSLFLVGAGLLVSTSSIAQAGELAQQPTVSIATVTGTPQGPTARVNADQDQINVRSGPGTGYTKVGVLVAGQTVPALGKSAAGLWIEIAYSGVQGGKAWVYSPLVTLTRGGELGIIAPPPTPTPLVTPTIDPTLAAEFIQEIPSTHLPTFTAPPPLVVVTYAPEGPLVSTSNFPMGLIISIFGILGLLGGLFSLFRGR